MFDADLTRPRFAFAALSRESLLEQIRSRGVLTMTVPLSRSLPDAGDDPFLEVALAAAAACLITGNQKHYPARWCQGIKVISPAAFLKMGLN